MQRCHNTNENFKIHADSVCVPFQIAFATAVPTSEEEANKYLKIPIKTCNVKMKM